MIIDKPSGLIVHPGAGNYDGTLYHYLLEYYPLLYNIPRAGIIHRLDKNTTGLMIIAKTLNAYNFLFNELFNRNIKREYQAIVSNNLNIGKTIKTMIHRNTKNRLKMMVSKTNGKEAITHFKILENYRVYTRIICQLETGRTHQIRVHMEYIKSPILGDPLYNPHNVQFINRCLFSKEAINNLKEFKRQALHAYKLSFKHPVDNKKIIQCIADLPQDFKKVINVLRQDLYMHNKI